MPPFSKEDIELLSRKYKEGTLTAEERALFIHWYAQLATTLEHSEAGNVEGIKERILQKTYQAIEVDNPLPATAGRRKRFIRKYSYLTAAAVFLFVAAASIIFYVTRPEKVAPVAFVNGGVVPGSDKAILTLGNGKTIDLTSAPDGQLATDNNIVLMKQKGGQVQFAGDAQASGGPVTIEYNTIQIPKGGQWKLLLQDGTKVWLNAASSLKFPTSFTGKTREIFLEGEGYFEIAKDISHPFIVHTIHQRVEVLGTHFNVNAYTEDSNTQTTLLEGEVKINGTALLRPGQKAVINGSSLKIQEADIDQAIAWKEGNFIFNGEDLAGIMRQVSRWYNVDVKFQSPELKEITFSGSVSRSISFASLIHRLSLTKEVSFKTEDNTIIVQPYTPD